MNRHKLTSVQLTPFYLHRIKKLNPKLNAVITVSKSALHDARTADKARRHGDHRPLLGIPVIVKDNINTTGMPTTAGSYALEGSSPARRLHRPEAEGRRRDHHRQGEPVRVGELPIRAVVERLERDRRPDEHGPRPRSEPVRIELRLRRRRGGRPRDRHRRHGDGRLDRLPVGRERDRRHQADHRARQPRRGHPDLGGAGHRGPDDPQRDRRRGGPRRDDRRRPGRPGDSGLSVAMSTGTTPSSSTSDALRGARIGVWREGTYDPAISPEIHADHQRHDRGARGPGRDRHRQHADPDRARLRAGVRRAPLRVQGRHRGLPRDVHEASVPEDAPGPDRLQQRASGAGRARGTRRSSSSPRRPAAGPIRPARRRASSRPRLPRTRSTTRWSGTTSTRSSRRRTAPPG